MRFTIAVVGAFAAVAAAQSGSATKSDAPSVTVSLDPVQSSMYACVDACDEGDVKCQSHCIAVPAPNEDQANATTECMAKCEQGNGTEAETARYAACQQKCITQHFYVTSEGTPKATGAAGDEDEDKANSTGSASARPTQSSGSDDESSEGSQTSSAPTSSSTDDAAAETPDPDSGAATLAGTSAAFFGLIAAVFAL